MRFLAGRWLRRLAAGPVALAFAGCGDVVTSHYGTYAEAAADGLFERGWVPGLIPQSSTDIRLENNVDTNISTGEFAFSAADANALLLKLQTAGATRKTPFRNYERKSRQLVERGYVRKEFLSGEEIYIFHIHRSRGHAYMDSWVQRPTAK